MDATAIFAASGLALYVGHHVGDYWVQTDHQARHKGDAGHAGRSACFLHVTSYLVTQWLCLLAMSLATGAEPANWWSWNLALAISGVTHYAADRREHGLMFWLARRLPGKVNFLRLGVPRPGAEIPIYPAEGAPRFVGDNPSLGTGAWALDQSWHLFFGVFVSALIIAACG